MNPGGHSRILDGDLHDGKDDFALSEPGRLRRDAMLAMLQGAVLRQGRRRRIRRKAFQGTAIMAVLFAVGISITLHQTDKNLPIQVTGTSPENRRTHIRIADARPRNLSQWIAKPTGDLSRYCIDDRTLVATLTAIGRPAGLIRIEGRVRLTAVVTDPIDPSNPVHRAIRSQPNTAAGPTG